MFNIYLGIYIVLAILITAGITFKLISSGLAISGILFLIGAIYIFVVYGLKWFNKDSLLSKTPVSWPPTINTCPDYLMYYGRKMPDGTTKASCIDLIGVSKNGGLKVFPKGSEPPTSDDYYFSLITTSTDTSSKNKELCQRAITMGLTWEGITNGESCITPTGPVVPSGGSGSSDNNGCPSQ
jgi:hypothetical protein